MEKRLELLLHSLNLSPAQFADEIGLKRSGIYHIINGRNKPGMDFFIKVLERYSEISADWLLTGKGSMRKSSQVSMVEEPSISSSSSPALPTQEKKRLTEPKRPEIEQNIKGINNFKKNGKKSPIQKIVIFYEDGTFSEHLPTDLR